MTGRTWLADRIDAARGVPADTLIAVIVGLVVLSAVLLLMWTGAQAKARARRRELVACQVALQACRLGSPPDRADPPPPRTAPAARQASAAQVPAPAETAGSDRPAAADEPPAPTTFGDAEPRAAGGIRLVQSLETLAAIVVIAVLLGIVWLLLGR